MWADQLDSRFLFFTGKGGVGKTSLACATALHLAETGKRVLIVSTDPASNLDEVFSASLGPIPTPIPDVPRLFGANLDPAAAAAAYRERLVTPLRGKLPEAVIRSMEEQFSGACTTEIAAFDEFVRLMTSPEVADQFDAIIFDTAPTGHTLRLLSLPSAWSGYLNTTTSESSCLGPLAGLQDQRAAYEQALAHLADPELTTVVLVARPEPSSLAEAARTQGELLALGVTNLCLLINAVFRASESADPIASEFARSIETSLAELPEPLRLLPRNEIPMLPKNAVGLEGIRSLVSPVVNPAPSEEYEVPVGGMPWETFIQEIGKLGRGVIMTMGKGGVGKTTVAVRLAQVLAAEGHDVLLTTTDPAGNVTSVANEAIPNLEVAHIDPEIEVAKYTRQTLQRASSHLDTEGLELLEEDLRSPCTEEIAVFRAFASAVAQGESRIVVIDTAPTGHTILLMDASEAYHREVARTQSDAPESVRQLLPRLRDGNYTRIVLVTLPEPTPVHEAMRLEDDLQRAGIQPFGWIVNRSLAAAGVSEPLLAARAAQEGTPIQEVLTVASRCCILPWTTAPLGSRPEALSVTR